MAAADDDSLLFGIFDTNTGHIVGFDGDLDAGETLDHLDDRLEEAVQSLPNTPCGISSLIMTYLDTFSVGLRAFDYTQATDNIVSANLSVTTMLVIGGLLLAAPIIFGTGWLLKVVLLIVVTVSAGLVSGLLQSPAGEGFLDQLKSALEFDDEGMCILSIVLIVLASIAAGATVVKAINLALFAAAAAAASGYGAWLSYNFASPWISEEYDVEMRSSYMYLFVGAVGLAGGYYLPQLATSLSEKLLVVLGSFVIVINKVWSDRLVEELQFGKYFTYYQCGLAAFIYLLTDALTRKRKEDSSLL